MHYGPYPVAGTCCLTAASDHYFIARHGWTWIISSASLTLAVLIVVCSWPAGDAAGIRAVVTVSNTKVMILAALLGSLAGGCLSLRLQSLTDASSG